MGMWDNFWVRWLEQRGFSPDERLGEKLANLSFTQSARFFIDFLGLKLTPATVLDEWAALILAERRDEMPLRPDALRFLDVLDAEDIPYGILTACLPAVGRAITAENGLAQRSRFLLFTDELGWSKAQAEPFIRAAAALDIPPEHCAVVEDSWTALTGARAAGMKFIAIRDAGQSRWDELSRAADLAGENFLELIAGWRSGNW
jgi:HAD superfamily hydrolase (TIGR01509 family)